MRAPDPELLDDRSVLQGYLRAGTDHEGSRLPRSVQSLVRSISRGNLGQVAVRIDGLDSYILVRHPSRRSWIALLCFWGLGISVYSRWDHIATVHVENPLVTDDFLSLIRTAQQLSAQRPVPRGDGPDFLDPANPTLEVNSKKIHVEPDDWVDRLVQGLRRWF